MNKSHGRPNMATLLPPNTQTVNNSRDIAAAAGSAGCRHVARDVKGCDVGERSDGFSFEEQLRQRHARQFRFRLFSTLALILAMLASAAPWVPPTSIVAIDRPLSALANLAERIRFLIEPLTTWIGSALSQAPALSLGLLALAVTAPLVVVGMVLRGALSGFRSNADAGESSVVVAPDAARADEGGVDRTGRARPARAWLSRDDAADTTNRYHLESELTRISRAADNEIRLKLPAVERYHAAISRSPEFDFYVVALGDGNARLEVNGQQVARHRLRPGDVIGISDVRFVFSREGA